MWIMPLLVKMAMVLLNLGSKRHRQTHTHTHNYEQLPCPVSMYTAPEIGECMVNEMQLRGEVLIIQI
jgi:hypothetical protein